MENETNIQNTGIKINANTQIVFTIKGFFGLISSILGLFYAFYMLVVVPRVDTIEEYYKDQINQNKEFYEELVDINSSLGSLNSTITGLNKKPNTNNNNNNQTGGSFGN